MAPKKCAAQEPEKLPEIEAGGREQSIAAVSRAVLQPIPAQQAIVFRVADDRFDHRPALEPAFDLLGDPSFLSRDVYGRVRVARNSVPFVALVGRNAIRAASHHVPQIIERRLQRVTVVRVSMQRPRVQDEVATLGRMHIGGNGDLAAEFVGGARFALADALYFRRVPGVEIPSIAALLVRDVPRAFQRLFESLPGMF